MKRKTKKRNPVAKGLYERDLNLGHKVETPKRGRGAYKRESKNHLLKELSSYDNE